MRKQRCPTAVFPVAEVPRLMVQYSRITVASPTSSQVSSPRYFRSCGSLPSTLPYPILTPVPIGYGSVLGNRSEEHTSELQSRFDLVCRLLLEKKKKKKRNHKTHK